MPVFQGHMLHWSLNKDLNLFCGPDAQEMEALQLSPHSSTPLSWLPSVRDTARHIKLVKTNHIGRKRKLCILLTSVAIIPLNAAIER